MLRASRGRREHSDAAKRIDGGLGLAERGPSAQVLAPLLAEKTELYDVDVVLHANVVSRITNLRTNEAREALPGYGDWTRFRPCKWTLEDQDALDRKLEPLRKRVVARTVGDTYHDGGASLMNLLRALHSLRETAKLVEARELETGRQFHAIASVRVDTIFTRELPASVFAHVRKSRVARLFIPHFGCSINGDLVMNDRFAVGQRRPMLESYLAAGRASGPCDVLRADVSPPARIPVETSRRRGRRADIPRGRLDAARIS